MKNLLLVSVALAFVICMPSASFADEFVEGKNYHVLAEPGALNPSDKIEVIMFMWYGCTGCYKLDPRIAKWAESVPADVDFKRLPALFFPKWEFHGKVFLCLEKMGFDFKRHYEVFGFAQPKDEKDIKPGDIRLDEEKDLPAVLAHLGIDREKFMELYESDEIADAIDEIHSVFPRLGVPAVPAMVINGRYQFTIKDVEGKHFLALADYLIAKEREAVKR